ncbi:right-handed parallel beta-helix repeat-containing protein [Glycomyces arizonensis]|uniref:right-handed parallel beta-helix repeat-containing protein n=1 Tax=Glycomyces arizonensis TaxID=256035 RepID=UPI00041AF396|nr:right-handed parallel beta-helix repeat-containing protein [Glycomyces arizonensis]
MAREHRTARRLAAKAAVLALITSAALSVSPAASAAPAHLTVYVSSTEGDDANPGTKQAPLKTIEAARDALAGRTAEDERGTVYLRGGEYVLDETVELTGDEHSWVTYTAYKDEQVSITGSHELPADGWHRLGDLADEPQYSSSSRIADAVRDAVWVYDLGAAGIDPGTLYKNGFNWIQQPFATELIVDGSIQTLAEYPNGDSCSTTDTSCHLWGTGGKWDAEGPEDLMNVDLVGRFGEQDDWQWSGTTPRAQFEDKKQETDDPDSWSYERMLTMTPSVFTVGGRAAEGDRYQHWAPEAEPVVDDLGGRGFGEYSDVATQLDPQWIEDIDNARYETEAWLSGYLGNNYANDMVRLLSWSGDRLYTKYPSMYIPQDEWTKVKVVNALSEMDATGEYYIDRHEGNDVLYYLPEGDTLEGKDIELMTFDKNFFRLEGTAGVELRDVAMSGSLVTGVQLLDAVDTLIDGVEISNVSMDAIRIGQTTESLTALPDYETTRGGHGNTVQNSYLHDLGGGGVLLGGGDRETLERGDNTARHNEIARFSQLATYTPAGYLYGVGNTFEYNYVHDAPHMAIQIMGNDMKVNHNHFQNLVLNAGDQGVVYTGRDYTYLGNEIAYNYFETIGGSNNAFYMDDGASGMRFHHNVVQDANAGVFFQSGHSNTANDNVYIDVEHTGHDKLYHEDGETDLPVSNGWVVQSRFDSFLDVREGEKYSATPEIVATWHDHYTSGEYTYSDGTPILYPEITDWYVPRVAATGEDCTAEDYAVDAANGCDRATVWEDPNSLYVPARNELDHSVVLGGGDYAASTVEFANPPAAYELSRWSDKIGTNVVRPASLDDAGLNAETLRFSKNGAVADEFGKDWVQEWNRHFTLDGMGR